MKVIKGDFAGYYASVEENASNDLFHIQYFKSQFGKYVVNEGGKYVVNEGSLSLS